MEATSRGEKLGLKRGEMGSERLNSLRPKKFNFDKIRGGKEWEKFKASIEKMVSPEAKNERMEMYKANYLKGLENAFGEYAKDLIEMLKEIPADLFVDTFYKEQEATIEFIYDPLQMESKLNILEGIWQDVKNDYDEVHR
jgi:hypothetical protein